MDYLENAFMIIFMFTMIFDVINGSGRMIDPQSRQSLWRFSQDCPSNSNDDKLNCGGVEVQWGKNNGECGVCGDRADQKQPRDYETGGRQYCNKPTRFYMQASQITIRLNITNRRRGWFEFKLCPNDENKHPVTQECLDSNKLVFAHSKRTRIWYDEKDHPKDKYLELEVLLPRYVTCLRCVLQWKYQTGTKTSDCRDCKWKEQFYACADIVIFADPNIPPPTSTPRPTYPPTSTPARTTTRTTTSFHQDPNPTSKEPSQTTVGKNPTTKEAVLTTDAPVLTTDAAASTTDAAVPTTDAAVLSTEAAVPTTEIPAPTSEHSSSTFANAPNSTEEVASTTEELASTPELDVEVTTESAVYSTEVNSTEVNSTALPAACEAYDDWKNAPSPGFKSMDEWCAVSCAAHNCPADMCFCDEFTTPAEFNCLPVKEREHLPEMARWCRMNCARGHCPSSHCWCPGSRKPGPTAAPPTYNPNIYCFPKSQWMEEHSLWGFCRKQCAIGFCSDELCRCSNTGYTSRVWTLLGQKPLVLG